MQIGAASSPLLSGRRTCVDGKASAVDVEDDHSQSYEQRIHNFTYELREAGLLGDEESEKGRGENRKALFSASCRTSLQRLRAR